MMMIRNNSRELKVKKNIGNKQELRLRRSIKLGSSLRKIGKDNRNWRKLN